MVSNRSAPRSCSPVLTIVVVSWNTRDKTLRCLESIERTTRLRHEIILVDNASSDGSEQAVREGFPEVKTLQTRANLGFAAGANRGIAIAQGDYVALLNPDAEVTPAALETLVSYLERHPDVAICGPRLHDPLGRLQPSAHRFYSTLWSLLENQLVARWPWRYRRSPILTLFSHDAARRVDWISGACLLARRSAFAAVGPLDETFWMYGEEVDWQMRAARLKLWTHFVPQAVVIHEGGGAAKQWPDRLAQAEQDSRLRLVAKHHGPLAVSLYRAKAALAQVVWQTTAFLARMTSRS